jgi:hypothetical protein
LRGKTAGFNIHVVVVQRTRDPDNHKNCLLRPKRGKYPCAAFTDVLKAAAREEMEKNRNKMETREMFSIATTTRLIAGSSFCPYIIPFVFHDVY